MVIPTLEDIRLLLVEDEFFILMDLRNVFEEAGARVTTATTVAEGLSATAADGFDAAVLDVRLPDGEVFPVATALTERRVPLVFHSGHIRAEDVSLQFPAALTLSKPAREEALINAVRRLVGAEGGPA